MGDKILESALSMEPPRCVHPTIESPGGDDRHIDSSFKYLVNHPDNANLLSLLMSVLDTIDHEPTYVGHPCSGCGEINYFFAFCDERPLCQSCYESTPAAAKLPFTDDSHFRITNAYLRVGKNPPIIDITNAMMTVEQFYPIVERGLRLLDDELSTSPPFEHGATSLSSSFVLLPSPLSSAVPPLLSSATSTEAREDIVLPSPIPSPPFFAASGPHPSLVAASDFHIGPSSPVITSDSHIGPSSQVITSDLRIGPSSPVTASDLHIRRSTEGCISPQYEDDQYPDDE